jgi:hypothetical protein
MIMADDQQQNSTQQNTHYKDSVDVLRVVEMLEKKYGKELLTKEQRERVGEIIQHHSDVHNFSKKDAFVGARKIVMQLKSNLEFLRDKYYSSTDWNGMECSEKKDAEAKMFKCEYGGTPKEVGFALFTSFLEVA